MSKTKRRTRKNMKLRFLIPLLPAIGGAILMLGQDASAAVVNVTLGKPVTSSGFADPYEPSRAVDGSVQPTSRWYQATAGEKWIQVDLGDIYTLSIWKVTGMGLYYEWSGGLDPYHFHLETSLNGSNWKTVDTVQGNTNPLFQRSLPPVDARYVRLVIDQGNAANNQWASVLEFEAYGELLTAPGTPGNFAGVFQDGAPKLSWDAAAKAATYELRRNGTLIYSGPLTSYTDADVLPAGEITYSVQAVNAKGSSPAAEITVNVP
ncbi:MAG: discoidin domain-containing protein, partial [Paenibacillus macerans]